LPPTWSHANPVDVVGDADPQRLARAFEIIAADPDNDGVLVLFCPTVHASAEQAARALLGPVTATRKPVVLAWLGEQDAARAGRFSRRRPAGAGQPRARRGGLRLPGAARSQP